MRVLLPCKNRPSRRAWPTLSYSRIASAKPIFALLIAVAGMPAAAQPGEDLETSAASSDWVGGCDNHGRCTMIGRLDRAPGETGSMMPGDRPVMLRIESLARAMRPIRVRMIPQALPSAPFDDPARYDGPYLLSVLPGSGSPAMIQNIATDLTPDTAELVYSALLTGHSLMAVPLSSNAVPSRLRFAEIGFADLWVRLDSIAAAQLRRNRAHRRVQRAPVPLVAARELPLEMTGVARVPPLPFNERCSWLIGVDYQLRRFDLGQGRELWQLRCADAGRNPVTHFYLRGPEAGMAVPVSLADALGNAVAQGNQGLPNAGFEFDFGVIRATRHDGDGEDCGVSWTWGWTGETFVLIEQLEMPRCFGADSPDWIAVYRRNAVGPDR